MMWLGEEQPEVSRTPAISRVKFQYFDRQRLLFLGSVASLLYRLIVRVAYYYNDLSFLTNNIDSEEKLLSRTCIVLFLDLNQLHPPSTMN